MSVATWLMARAVRWMPVRRRTWAEAMQAEFDVITESERLGFATGCLWAALTERIDLMGALVSVGRWGVGAVTAAYGAFHLWCLANALGQMADGTVHAHDQWTWGVWLSLYLAGMGAGNMVAAIFLVRWRPMLFWLGCAIVAVTAGALTIFDVMQFGLGTRMVLGWQFVPLAMLAGAGVLLAWMAKGKSGPLAA